MNSKEITMVMVIIMMAIMIIMIIMMAIMIIMEYHQIYSV